MIWHEQITVVNIALIVGRLCPKMAFIGCVAYRKRKPSNVRGVLKTIMTDMTILRKENDMARYIELDQDKIKRLKREAQQFQDDIVCAVGTDFMENIAKAENKMIFDILKGLEDDTAADVVPKSEVDKLEYTLTGVMHSVDKWLDGEELKQDEVNRAITMREKTLRIVEQYQEKLEDYKDCWYKIHDSYNADCRESYNIGRQEVAREIFEEIEKALDNSVETEHFKGTWFNLHKCMLRIAELKKKYTESES